MHCRYRSCSVGKQARRPSILKFANEGCCLIMRTSESGSRSARGGNDGGGSYAFNPNKLDGGAGDGGDVVARAGGLLGQGSGQLPRGGPNGDGERDADPRRGVQPGRAADQS